jgi:Domain of unknown function (DUF222)
VGAAAPATTREALDMVCAGLGYLAAADAAQLGAATQAETLRELEQHDAMATAARAGFLAAFTAGQSHAGDGDYSAVSWLIHRTGITRGAAVGHTAWAKRAATHPRVLAALAARQVSESVARVICLWTGKLPQEYRDQGDEQLLAAFAGGLGLGDLAGLFAEMFVRARGDLPDQDPGREFADREVKLATTIGGAGVLHGDLTAGCAAAVAAVLDALGAPAGKEDDRTKGQRYHDALQEAMRRLTAAGLLPERAGQPVKAWAHISLADLMLLDGDSALQEEWTAQVRARWAARRAGVRDRRERRRLAGRGRRRGDRLRRGDGPHRHRRHQRGRAGRPGPAVRGTGRPAAGRDPGRGLGGDRASRDRQGHESFTAFSNRGLTCGIRAQGKTCQTWRQRSRSHPVWV